jgi:hypothetical protein
MDSGAWTWPDDLWLVPCTELHTYEVFYANHSFWGMGGSFPGKPAVENDAPGVCEKQFTSYTGLPGPDYRYSWTQVLPIDGASWDAGYRGLVCIAYSANSGHPNGFPVTGTIKGA